MNTKNIGTMVLAGAGSGVGGYALGKGADAKRTTPATSALGSYAVLFPLGIGLVGYLLLRRRNKTAGQGLLYGGLAGAAYGYTKFGTAAAGGAAGSPTAMTATASSPAGTGANTGTATATSPSAAGQAAYLGANPRRRRRARGMGAMSPGVRRALRNPNGSGIGDVVLPRPFQNGSPAFGGDAWSRRR